MSYNIELMIRIAKLYYLENMTQDSIAKELNISVYKVHRSLKSAKNRGIVRCVVVKPLDLEKN